MSVSHQPQLYNFSAHIKAGTYLFIPINRYLFQGAKLIKKTGLFLELFSIFRHGISMSSGSLCLGICDVACVDPDEGERGSEFD